MTYMHYPANSIFQKKLEKLEQIGMILVQLMLETGIRKIPETNSEEFWVMEQIFNKRIMNRITFDFFQLYFTQYKDEKNHAVGKIMIDDQKLEDWFEKREQEIIDFGKDELNSMEKPIEVFWDEKYNINE